ncbi:MAG: acyl-CoA thioesterase [Verrucomicrobia bacterium]|nr:MAG: acyl-CoA thioesterase [Verrucomicrobiota bacterium]TAE87867.1 MAG: acyl-CoA thioesterase [Verrucomicrobiota bacterium]TAF25610.1 MAG: acyl-CoA thioesterase [Verrucomicrobiota bacterium]TAF41323.1 MAG: acyl-CoA thioesterase [Verrucomicrobiota bacterium]
METHRLVLPEDLNHFGFLFGGRLLAWVDEACWIAASLDFPHCQFVTIGMDKVEFRHSVRQGTILAIRCLREREGLSSVTYQVEVFDRRQLGSPPIFATSVTYVSVDDAGRKRSIR